MLTALCLDHKLTSRDSFIYNIVNVQADRTLTSVSRLALYQTNARPFVTLVSCDKITIEILRPAEIFFFFSATEA